MSQVQPHFISARRIAGMLCVFLLALFSLVAATQAQAQNVDWLVNIDDAAFDPIPAGGTIEYVIDVDNNGSDLAPATELSVTVPANTSLTAISGDFGPCTVGGTALSLPLAGPATVGCEVDPIPGFGTETGTFSILTTREEVLSVTASVPTDGDTLAGNNSLTEQTTVQAGADLGVTIDAPTNVASGDFIDFDIGVTNFGPDDANAFTLEFPIPTGVANITGPGGGPLPSGCSISGGTVVCDISGGLADAASLSRSFRGQVSAGGGSTITSTASVLDGDPLDPITDNNTALANTTTDPGTDISIDISQTGGGNLLVGDTTRFTISSEYTGSAPNNLTIRTTIPDNYTFTAADISSPDGWNCQILPFSQDVECTLAGGGSAGANVDLGEIFIDAVVDSVGSTTTTATIEAETPFEDNLSNNSDSVGATISTPTTDFVPRKSGPNPPLAVIGNSYNYNLSARNNGNAAFVGTLRLTDNLPAGMRVISYGLRGWTCTPDAPVDGPVTIVCEREYTDAAPLNPRTNTPSVTVRTEITETTPASDERRNTLVVSAPVANFPESNTDNNETSYTVSVTDGPNAADVTGNKVAAVSPVVVGEVQTFFIEIVNLGPETSFDVRMEDNLSDLINSDVGATNAGFISSSITPGVAVNPTCSSSRNGGTARRLNCVIAELPVCSPDSDLGDGISDGTCPVVEVQVRPGGDGTSRSNSARVTSFGTPDPVLNNRDADADYDVELRADVTVSKNATPSPGNAGQRVTYVIAATNLDELPGGETNVLSTAQDVTITDRLPDNVIFVSATPAAGSCTTEPAAGAVTSNSELICNLGPLASGAQRTVTVVVRPTNDTIGTTILNEVDVTTTTTETNPDNNSADISVDIAVPELDLLINKDDNVDPVIIGETTVYTLRVTNAGPSASENVVVTDILPEAIFAYRSHTVSGDGTCGTVPIAQTTPDPDPLNRTLECTFPYIAPGDSETVLVTMEAIERGTIANEVSISSDEIVAGYETEPLNNRTSETTTSRSRADPAVTSKTASVSTINLREEFDFTITLVNNPDSPAQEASDVVLSDTLPDGMVLTGAPTGIVTAGTASVNACEGVADDTDFSCDFGVLSADAAIEITVPVKVVAITSQGQTLTNTASVATSSADTNPGNNASSGGVSASGASLAGTVYRDFNDSATPTMNGQDEAVDTGISGITMTLTGTAVDGETITETAVTDGNGDYIFPFLPEGTYTVTRGEVDEAGLVTGQNTVGSEGGTLPSRASIAEIPLAPLTAATDYDFAEVPGAEMPAIALVKAVDLSELSSPPVEGDIVRYTFTVRNTGNVTLTDVTIDDDVDGVTLSGSPIPTLLPGGENSDAYTATYILEEDDLGEEIENFATATGTPPSGPDVTDTSGTDFDNDNPTQTTIVIFIPDPDISLQKTVNEDALDDGAQPGDVLSYSFVITNTGNTTLNNVELTDALPGVVLNGSPISSLDPGESDAVSYTATYTLTEADIDAGQVINPASVEGTSTEGGTVLVNDTDSVTTTFDPESPPADEIDAEPEVFPPFTDGGTTTSMLESDTYNGDPATLETVTIRVIREDDGVSLDPTTALITLEPGLPAGPYQVEYEICAINDPDLCDTAIETVFQAALPGVETTKTQELVDNGDGRDGIGDTLVYTITVENTGNIALDTITLTDTMTDLAGAGTSLTTGPDFVSASAGSGEGALAIGETATYTATFLVDEQVVNARGVENSVEARGVPVPIDGLPDIPDEVTDISDNGDDTDGNTSDDPTLARFIPLTLGEGDILLTKDTTADVVRRGQGVPYTLSIRNDEDVALGPFTLVDTLPAGFIFIPDSASVDPSEITAGRVTWEGLTVPANDTLTIELAARVLNGARAGEHVNTARLFDPVTGDPVTPEATATVRLLPEAIFDCGDVIGKVFTDLDGDGYQDGGPPREDGITDQTYAAGKGGKPITAPVPQTEDGIPNVRLVTVDGLIITTDAFGRFSVPCAMLPEDKGSNFILKLDPRSLPTGYRVTTENPRVVRLTPGMMTEMNFGAALGRVVRIDLDRTAFARDADNRLVPGAPLQNGIAALLPRIADETAILRLTFHVPADADAQAVKAARAMMRATEKHIRREWRKVGRNRLLVEQHIARVSR